MSDFVGELTILALSGNGIKCTVRGSNEPFWLPRNGDHVKWDQDPAEGQTIRATVASWLANKHRQLGGEDSDYRRDQRPPASQASGAPQSSEGGGHRDMSGILFKNRTRKRAPSSPTIAVTSPFTGQSFASPAGSRRESTESF